jgi:hypothetical protein
MRYMGKHPKRCDCYNCRGDGRSKAVNRSLKHGERQKAKRRIRKEKDEDED